MDVAAWLERLGLGQYAAAFEENAIDGEVLADLTDGDLASIGVLLGHRKKILKAIADFAEIETLAPATGGSSATLSDAGQRRQVTVLFSDLSDFTGLSAKLDAEETHALLNRYFAEVDAIVEDYGGRVDKHIGDGVMAVFGAPVAHSDDPERALRAARDIHRSLAALELSPDLTLTAHVGIASGQVVASCTGSDRHREYTVTGDTVNLASRLTDLARPGETLVSDAVHGALSRAADFSSRGLQTIKGLAVPLRVWAFDGLRDEMRADLHSEFVGRQSELRQFRSLVEDVNQTQAGQMLVLRGEPGIGKTRLVAEFLGVAASQGLRAHKCNIVDFGTNKGRRALQDLVMSLLDLPAGAPAEERTARKAWALSNGLVSPPHAVFLNDLLDLPQPSDLQAAYESMTSQLRKSGLSETLGELIAALAKITPLLIVFEDIHWADPVTLDLLTGMAEFLASASAMIVLTTRVEGWTLEPGWLSRLRSCPLTTIELQPLRREDSLRLASTLVTSETENLAALVDRADGNPLFLEQLLRTLSRDRDQPLPDTIQGLVLARIDGLPEGERTAVLAASVLGSRFELDLLQDLIGLESYDGQELVRHQLLRAEGNELVFSHALVRDGIYSSLLRDQRRALHLRAAGSLRGRNPSLHAEHLDLAEAPEAAAAYLAAARDEAQRVRPEVALQLARRGLEIGSGDHAHLLWMLSGDLLLRLGQVANAIEAYREARSCASDSIGRCRALIGAAEGLRITESYGELLDSLALALEELGDADLPNEHARICQLKGSVHFVHGDYQACLRENDHSLELARQAGSQQLQAQALGNLGDAEFAAGRMASAYDRFDQCIKLSREQGLDNVIAANQSMRGQALLYLCQPEQALVDCEESLALAVRLFNPRAELVARLVGVYVLELSDSDALRVWAEAGVAIARRLGAHRFEQVFFEYLGRVAAIDGDRETAEHLVGEAVWNFRKSESSMRFLGGRALGSLALVSRDPDRRRALLAEGEELLQKRVGAHNPLWFYRDAIEVSLDLGDWNSAERFATLLEDVTRDQPLPWGGFFANRGRALAMAGRGEGATEALKSLHAEAWRIGFTHTLGPIERAL